MNVAATITFTPGTLINRWTSPDCRAAWAISRSTVAISASRNSIWRSALSTVSRSSTASSSPLSHARPLIPNTSLNGARPTSWRINTAWTSFFARLRAHTSWLRRERRRRITHVASSGIHTASNDPAARSRANVLASRRSVFARAWRIVVSDGLTTTTCATCGSRIRAISHAFPVTSKATRSSGHKLPANSSRRSGLVSTRPAERTSPSSTIATSQKSRCTSNPTDLTPPPSKSLNTGREKQWANDTDGSALEAQPDKSQGRPLKSPGSTRPSRKPACPYAFSQRAPVPVRRP